MYVIRRVREGLDKAGIEYSLVGGSSIGSVFIVPKQYEKRRIKSRQIKISALEGQSGEIDRVMTTSKWKSVGTSKAVIYRTPEELAQGRKVVHDVMLYAKDYDGRYHVSIALAKDKEQIMSYASTVEHKLFRGKERDIKDLANVFAIYDMHKLLNPQERVNQMEPVQQKIASAFEQNSGRLLEELRILKRKYPRHKETIEKNVEHLQGFVESIAKIRKRAGTE